MEHSLYHYRVERKVHMSFLTLFLVLQGFPTSAQSTASSSSTTSSGLPRIIAPPSSPPPKSHTTSVGLAIGIVLGVLGVFVLGLLIWWVARNRRRKRDAAAREWLRGIEGGESTRDKEGGSGRREDRRRSDITGKYTTSSGGSWSPKANSASPTSVVQPHAQLHPHTQKLNRGAVGANEGIWTRIKDLFSPSSSTTTAAVQASSPQGTWPPPPPTPGMDPNQVYYPYPYDPNSPHNAYADPNTTPYNPYDPNYAPPYPTYPYPYPNPNPNLYQAPYAYPYDPNAPPNRAPNRYMPGYTLSTITEKSTPQSFANRSLRHGGASSVIMGGAGGSVNVGTYSPMSGLTVSEELGGAGYWTASEGGHEADGGEMGMGQRQNQIGGFGAGGDQKEGKKEKKEKEKRKKHKKDKKHKTDSHEGEKKSDHKEKRTSWFRS